MRHARVMGDFIGAIEEPHDGYDVCPGIDNKRCGNLKQPRSKLCNRCNMRQVRRQQQAALDAQLRDTRREADEFYTRKLAEGWTWDQVIQDIQQKRVERGDDDTPQAVGRYISKWTVIV